MVKSGNGNSIRVSEFDQQQFLLTDLEPELDLHFVLHWLNLDYALSLIARDFVSDEMA